MVRLVLGLVVTLLAAGSAASQTTRGHAAEAHDMELVGHDELQGRSAYQPTIHRQGAGVLPPPGPPPRPAPPPPPRRAGGDGTPHAGVDAPAEPPPPSPPPPPPRAGARAR